MKKNYKYSALVVVCYSFFIVFSSNSGGSPGGYTGSELDGKTCGTNGGCHNTPANERDLFSTNIPESGIEANTTYQITVSPAEDGINRYGFEFMATNEENRGVGVVTDNATIMLRGNGLRATHNSSSNSGNNGVTWTFDWTSPETITSDITFYVASIAANGDGGTSGDRLLVSSLTVEPAIASVVNLSQKIVNIYPNPAINYLNVDFSDVNHLTNYKIISTIGQVVSEGSFLNQIDISNLKAGLYFLKILEDNQVVVTTNFIKL